MVINKEVVEGRAQPLYIYSDRRGDVGDRRLTAAADPRRCGLAGDALERVPLHAILHPICPWRRLANVAARVPRARTRAAR